MCQISIHGNIVLFFKISTNTATVASAITLKKSGHFNKALENPNLTMTTTLTGKGFLQSCSKLCHCAATLSYFYIFSSRADFFSRFPYPGHQTNCICSIWTVLRFLSGATLCCMWSVCHHQVFISPTLSLQQSQVGETVLDTNIGIPGKNATFGIFPSNGNLCGRGSIAAIMSILHLFNGLDMQGDCIA